MNLEYLRHGKALCGKVFRRFVETFNFHNDFIANLKGDADLQVIGMGHVKVDRTDERHPVIRCPGCGESKERSADSSPSPFAFDGTSIVNNVFYWDGVLQELDDFETSETCTVYLTCTQTAPSSSVPDPDWEFELAESVASAPSGGRAINLKLYDIEDNKVTMDYRTTFLDLSSPHRVAWFPVMKPTGDSAVIIDATDDDDAAVSVVGNGKSILLDTRDLTSGKQVRVRTLTVEHSDGTKTEYKILADQNVTVKEGGGDLPDVDLLKDIELKYDSSTHYFTAKKTTYNLKTGQTIVGNEETIFTAVPHSTNSSAS